MQGPGKAGRRAPRSNTESTSCPPPPGEHNTLRGPGALVGGGVQDRLEQEP